MTRLHLDHSMKHSFDKVLLIVSGLVMAGSVVFFILIASPGVDRSGDAVVAKGQPVKPVQAKPYDDYASLAWEEPLPQDEEGLWLYDIFTPPKIWWDPIEKQLIPQSPKRQVEPNPFGIILAGFNRNLYRIQFDAYFGGMGNTDSALIQFYDRELDRTCRGRVGDVMAKSEFKILECRNELEDLGNGIRNTVTRIVILDMRLDTEIELNSEDKRYLEDDFSIQFQTTDKPYGEGSSFSLKKIGEQFSIGEDTFILRDFDFDNRTVVVEKLLKNGQTELKTLLVAGGGVNSPAPDNQLRAFDFN